ncbi:MAG: phage major capsid protein, partial [Pseudomonadota bacterium]
METMKSPARVRGLVELRAERPANASELANTINELGRGFEEFKAKMNESLDDAVRRDEVETLNSAIGDMQASIDAVNTRLEGVVANGGGSDTLDELCDPEYVATFEGFFRSGRNEEAVQDAQRTGYRADISATPDADGGFLAPIEWDRSVTRALREVSPLRRICGSVNVSTLGFTRVYDLDGTAGGWVDEKTDARSETATPTLGSLQFDAMEVYAMPASTQRMLDDGQIDVESWLGEAVSEKFADLEQDAFVNGDGDKK